MSAARSSTTIACVARLRFLPDKWNDFPFRDHSGILALPCGLLGITIILNMNTPTVPSEAKPGDDFLYEYGMLELKQQSDNYDKLDEKTGVVLGFALISIAEILGFLLLGAVEKNRLTTSHPVVVTCFFYAGLLATVAAVVTGLLELLPRSFSTGPTLEDLRPLAGEKPEMIKAAMVHALDCACDQNDEVNDAKSNLALATAVLVGGSLFCYAVAAAYLFAAVIN